MRQDTCNDVPVARDLAITIALEGQPTVHGKLQGNKAMRLRANLNDKLSIHSLGR